MDSLVTVLEKVEKMGFESQLQVCGKNLVSFRTGRNFMPDEVRIVHFYRFEGESNPDDSCIMYAIQAGNDEKGTLVDGYGPMSDSDTTDFLLKVKNITK